MEMVLTQFDKYFLKKIISLQNKFAFKMDDIKINVFV